MPNTLIVPLLALLLVVIGSAFALPHVRELIRAGRAAATARVTALRHGPADDGRRQQLLARAILRGVISGTDRTLRSRSLPDGVLVEVCGGDFDLLTRIHDQLEIELNEEWQARAAAEGWSSRGWVGVELARNDSCPAGRPRLRFDHPPLGRGDITPPVQSRRRPPADEPDVTPHHRGAYLLTDRNDHVPLDEVGREVVAGRGSELADIVVDDRHASKRHVSFTLEPDGGVRVLDLGSRNHTFVDDQLVTERVVYDDAEIRLGKECRLNLRWSS